jgi:hypothetical protein
MRESGVKDHVPTKIVTLKVRLGDGEHVNPAMHLFQEGDPELAFICFLKGNLPFGSIPPVRLELQGEGFGFFEPFELFAEGELECNFHHKEFQRHPHAQFAKMTRRTYSQLPRMGPASLSSPIRGAQRLLLYARRRRRAPGHSQNIPPLSGR